MEIFRHDPLLTFANLMRDQLEVEVRMRGRSILIDYSSTPKTIQLPSIEQGREDDVRIILGFCLHEGGHLRYTNPRVLEDVPDYVVKFVHNAIEDELVERRLEADFPNAREILEFSYREGHALVMSEQPLLMPPRDKSWLADENAVVERMLASGLDATDKALVSETAIRLEIERVSSLWFFERRGYSFVPLHDWKEHPWRVIFDEETREPARSSEQAFEQATRIRQRIGAKVLFSEDIRPVEDARKAIAHAQEKGRERSVAQEAFTDAVRACNEEIRQKQLESFSHETLQEAKDNRVEKEREKSAASKRLSLIRDRLHKVEQSEAKTQKRLVSRRKRVRQLEAELRALRSTEPLDPQEEAELSDSIERCRFNIELDENLLARKGERIAGLKKLEEAALDASLAIRTGWLDTIDKEAKAQVSHDEDCKAIKESVQGKHAIFITPLEKKLNEKIAETAEAEQVVNDILSRIGRRDGEIEAPFGAPGVLEFIIASVFAKFKAESLRDEVGEVDDGLVPEGARKYCPYTRDNDLLVRVDETPEGRASYEEAVSETRKVIRPTTESLRRLYSPMKHKIRVNVTQGRLDPRAAYKVGLVLNGAAVNVERIWRRIELTRDPKVAISIVLDCSGSMDRRTGGAKKSYMDLAREAATAISEVCRSLNIPHEILGHTTRTEDLQKKCRVEVEANDDGSQSLSVDGEEAGIKRGEVITPMGNFSRYVPFCGYVFKPFDEKVAPASLFTKFPKQDNLDGEAILWAARRLEQRKERTKILVVLTDSMPDALLSNKDELKRHLLSVCRQVEARENEGLFLFGIGMDEKVAEYFRHYSVLDKIEDLPTNMLGIVEHVLVRLVGSMG